MIGKASLIILLSLFSCKSSNPQFVNTGKIGSSKFYILKEDNNEKYPIFENSNPSGLNFQEIIELEELIKPKIQETSTTLSYDRQYYAALDEYGEKLVYIFLYCDETTAEFYDLTKERADVSDGGECYFKLKINFTKKKIIGYSVNGYG